MKLITQKTLLQLRLTHERMAMPDRAQIFRVTPMSNLRGQIIDSGSSELIAEVVCRLSYKRGRQEPETNDQQIGASVQTPEAFTVTLPVGTDIHKDDFVIVTVNGTERKFEVVTEVPADRSFQTAIRAHIKPL